MRERPKLVRRPDEGMIAGVAAGVAERYGIDVTLVRLVFVAVAVLTAGAPVIGLYLLAAVLLPREEDTLGINSLKGGVNDLVSRGRSLYEEGRRAVDRQPARSAGTMPDVDVRMAEDPTRAAPGAPDRPPGL